MRCVPVFETIPLQNSLLKGISNIAIPVKTVICIIDVLLHGSVLNL